MRIASWAPVLLMLPGCWLSHRAEPRLDAGAGDGAVPAPACAPCDCRVDEVCVMGSCRPPSARAVWARQYFSSSAAATGASFDATGALAVGGYVLGAADLGLGPIDVGGRASGVVAVLEADGSTRSARTFAGDAVQVTRVAFSEHGVWMAGVFGRDATVLDRHLTSARSPDAFIAHMGGASEPLAVLQFSGASDVRALSLAPSGSEVLVAGYYRGAATLGTTTLEEGTGAFIATTRGGGVASSSRLPELGADLINDTASVSSTDLVAVGFYGAGGPALPAGRGRGDGYVARLGSSGNVVWAVGIGGPGEDNARDVDADGDGNVYALVGIGDGVTIGDFTLEGEGALLVSLGPDGRFRWARAIGRGPRSAASGGFLALDAAGGPMVLVSFEGEVAPDGFDAIASHGGRDILWASYGRDGAALDAQAIGGERDDWPGGIATDGCGGLAVVGAFTGALQTDAGMLVSEGTDGFVTRWTQ